MSEQRYTAEEQELFDREFQRALRTEFPSVREEEIKAAAQRAAQQEVEQRRDVLREQLDTEVADTTTESATELRSEANREAPSKLILGVVLLILLLFILAALGQLPGFSRRSNDANAAAANTGSTGGPFQPQLGAPTATAIAAADPNNLVGSQTGRGLPNAGNVAAPGSIPDIDPNVSQIFAPYYVQHGGVRIFGLPISPVLTINGRQVQWFERARLEYWPEYANTGYDIQPGLVGSEYTDGRSFPKQQFFASRPGLRFFPETGHGVGGAFLDFWDANGGLDIFGYPLSDEIIEVLPETKQYHTVQYFQRARFELHRQPDGTDIVMLGLLGDALYLNQDKSIPKSVLAPTPVPLP